MTNELGKAKGKAESSIFRIRHIERKAMKMQGDVTQLYMVESDALHALDDLPEDRQVVKDAAVKQLRKYRNYGYRLESRWRFEEQKRRYQLKKAHNFIKGATANIKAIKARAPEGMRGEVSHAENNIQMDVKLAGEVVDILTGHDPNDLLHSQCYEQFLQFIRYMPIHREPIQPLIMDGRGMLTSIVSHCRYIGWDEVKTASYITKHWKDLVPVYLDKS